MWRKTICWHCLQRLSSPQIAHWGHEIKSSLLFCHEFKLTYQLNLLRVLTVTNTVLRIMELTFLTPPLTFVILSRPRLCAFTVYNAHTRKVEVMLAYYTGGHLAIMFGHFIILLLMNYDYDWSSKVRV